MKTLPSLILAVDDSDTPLGLVEKYKAHKEGILHRAFSIFIFRHQGAHLELLIHQRAEGKYHSSGLWTNTCCSHATNASCLTTTAKKRLMQEMGFCCELNRVGSFLYKEDVGNNLVEHEIDHVFVGFNDPEQIIPDAEEVQQFAWERVDFLLKLSEEEKKKFTVWFFQALDLALQALKPI